MHNRALHDTLAAFVEEAAWQLAEEVSGGAEIPFELVEQGRSSSPLYCYQPLTQRFLAERAGSLARLPSYIPAVQGMMGLPDLPAYLSARGRRPPGPDARSQADAALQAFIAAMWADATDFTYDDERFAAAFAELEAAVYSGVALSVVVTPVDGLVIEADEVPLGDGMALVRGVTLQDAPPELRGDEFATVAVLALSTTTLEQAGRRLRRLQTALRLWDEAEPALGPTAWARTDGAPGSRSRSPPGCAAAPATACSRRRRRTSCARSARSWRAGCRRRASSRGRCGASSSAASAARRSRG